jgi:DNA-binding PadR family transcriptional regulator
MAQVSLRAAILGFLSLEPTSGYTLKQRFEGSVRSFWSVTQSQIYRELHALEREKRVVSRREAGDGRPDRKIYELTAAGRRSLEQWLHEPLEPVKWRHPLLLRFVFSAEMPPAQLDELLRSYRDEMSRTRDEYRARLEDAAIFSLARSAREATLWRLSIENGLAWCDAEITWIDHARRKLGKGKRTTQRKATC